MTSATWPEADAFLDAVRRTPADAVTMAAGWTAHDVLAHAIAGGAELARLAGAHLNGDSVPATQTFEQREPAFRALSYGQLTELLAAGGLQAMLEEMAARDPDAAFDFTGWAMTATDLTTHARSELALHRWDLVGDDGTGHGLLSQPELTAHAVRSLNNFDVIRERTTARTARSGVSALRVRLRVDGNPDVLIAIDQAHAELAMTDPFDEPAITSSAVGRLLMLWGRRPAPCHGTRSDLPADALRTACRWLFA